jgi:predicted CoA-binding protein
MAETDAEFQQILEQAHSVAVVGIKDLESEDAYRIPQYLQAHGYRIVPVNPKLDRVLGQPAYATLRDVHEPIDIVNLFRATEHIPEHVEEILAMDPPPKAVWMQLGIHHGPGAARMRAAGIAVVQDRCIMVEHRRLFAAQPASDARA